MYKFLICSLFYVSLIFSSFSVKQDISFGYDDNFMRFSTLEINSYYLETHTENDYLGDSKTYDSAIISPSVQVTLSQEIFNKHKANFVSKIKYSEYTSSNQKSYGSFLGRFEFKIAPYSWFKFSYSILPKYYLRTYIDRDIFPLQYYPCYFSNESFYISYSHKLPIKKTWIDYKLIFNNQFYNQNFTEYDSRVIGFESIIKSKRVKSYYFSIAYSHYNSNNISYNSSKIIESTKMDRSYVKDGFKINIKKNFKDYTISSAAFKFYFNQRVYDLDSWYYESDNWKVYSDYDFRLELSKRINNIFEIQILGRHLFRNVSSSGSSEIIWAEDYKNHSRNEIWLKFIYNIAIN